MRRGEIQRRARRKRLLAAAEDEIKSARGAVMTATSVALINACIVVRALLVAKPIRWRKNKS